MVHKELPKALQTKVTIGDIQRHLKVARRKWNYTVSKDSSDDREALIRGA